MTAQRADESERVEGRRSQLMRNPPHVLDGQVGLRQQTDQQVFRPAGVTADEVTGRFEGHGEPRQLRPQPVVQIPTDAPPFFFARQHQPLPRLLQVQCQSTGTSFDLGGLDRDADLPAEIGQQPTIGR
jgi:hypothetical protein